MSTLLREDFTLDHALDHTMSTAIDFLWFGSHEINGYLSLMGLMGDGKEECRNAKILEKFHFFFPSPTLELSSIKQNHSRKEWRGGDKGTEDTAFTPYCWQTSSYSTLICSSVAICGLTFVY